jgi:hypothetical protein
MKPVEEGNMDWTKEKIQTDIIDKMTGIGNNLETVKQEISVFFDAEGKFIKPTGTILTLNNIVE